MEPEIQSVLSADDDWETRPHAIYVLGAGFSKPAGLPLASELWPEVYRRACTLTGRMAQFREDLEDFTKFKLECDGIQLTPETVDFEEFLGFLDVEYHLNLRGPDTWSTHGNEAQVVAKTLIGQVLAERMPSREAIPSLYLNFARKLRPGDTVLTFNYDVVLEGDGTRWGAVQTIPFSIHESLRGRRRRGRMGSG
jgi:hypothetical protein